LERHGRGSVTSGYGREPRNRLVPSSGEASGDCLAGRELRHSPSASPGARNACASIGQDQIARPSRGGESASRDPQGHHRNGRSLDDFFRDAVEGHASPTPFPLNAHDDEVGTLFDGNSKDFVSHFADHHAGTETVRIHRREQGCELPFGLCTEAVTVRRIRNFATEGVAGRSIVMRKA
jgi:hypothetical protein